MKRHRQQKLKSQLLPDLPDLTYLAF